MAVSPFPPSSTPPSPPSLSPLPSRIDADWPIALIYILGPATFLLAAFAMAWIVFGALSVRPAVAPQTPPCPALASSSALRSMSIGSLASPVQGPSLEAAYDVYVSRPPSEEYYMAKAVDLPCPMARGVHCVTVA